MLKDWYVVIIEKLNTTHIFSIKKLIKKKTPTFRRTIKPRSNSIEPPLESNFPPIFPQQKTEHFQRQKATLDSSG